MVVVAAAVAVVDRQQLPLATLDDEVVAVVSRIGSWKHSLVGTWPSRETEKELVHWPGEIVPPHLDTVSFH